MADRVRLESGYTERYRGFKSLRLRKQRDPGAIPRVSSLSKPPQHYPSFSTSFPKSTNPRCVYTFAVSVGVQCLSNFWAAASPTPAFANRVAY